MWKKEGLVRDAQDPLNINPLHSLLNNYMDKAGSLLLPFWVVIASA